MKMDIHAPPIHVQYGQVRRYQLVVVFEPGRMVWDEDIRSNSQHQLLETDVHMGETLGKLHS